MKRNNEKLTCRSCGAAMFWAETITGRRIPVDAVPVSDGNIRIVRRENRIPLAVFQKQIDTFSNWPKVASKETYLSHFVTCPQSKQWRKR